MLDFRLHRRVFYIQIKKSLIFKFQNNKSRQLDNIQSSKKRGRKKGNNEKNHSTYDNSSTL